MVSCESFCFVVQLFLRIHKKRSLFGEGGKNEAPPPPPSSMRVERKKPNRLLFGLALSFSSEREQKRGGGDGRQGGRGGGRKEKRRAKTGWKPSVCRARSLLQQGKKIKNKTYETRNIMDSIRALLSVLQEDDGEDQQQQQQQQQVEEQEWDRPLPSQGQRVWELNQLVQSHQYFVLEPAGLNYRVLVRKKRHMTTNMYVSATDFSLEIHDTLGLVGSRVSDILELLNSLLETLSHHLLELYRNRSGIEVQFNLETGGTGPDLSSGIWSLDIHNMNLLIAELMSQLLQYSQSGERDLKVEDLILSVIIGETNLDGQGSRWKKPYPCHVSTRKRPSAIGPE